MDPLIVFPVVIASILFYLAVFFRRCSNCTERISWEKGTTGPSKERSNRIVLASEWNLKDDTVQKREKYPLYHSCVCAKCKHISESACWWGTTDWIPVGESMAVTTCERCKGVGKANLKVYNIHNKPMYDLKVDCFLCEGHGWIKN
jgi:hypothetical protein